MKRVAVTYIVEGYMQKMIEVEDDVTLEEIEAEAYHNFPPIESYHVEIEMEESEDEEEDEDE